MRNKLYILFIALFATLTLLSCEQGDGVEPKGHQSHTMIMYMLGQSNGLESYLNKNIMQVEAAVTSSFPEGAKIYVFFEPTSKDPVLFRIEPSTTRNGEARRDTVKVYPRELSGVESATLEMVINDVLADEEKPAEAYGLLMSSHGMGWLPADIEIKKPRAIGVDKPTSVPMSVIEEMGIIRPEGALTKWIGQEGNNYMEVADVVEALDNVAVDFDYILFDACFMSSIEVLYELRNSASYILASQTEIMGSGFPMHKVIPALFNPKQTVMGNLVGSAHAFYKYYLQEATYKSGSIALVDCSQLEPLADMVAGIYSKGLRSDFDIDNVQYLELVPSDPNNRHTFFDLEDYMYYVAADRNDFTDLSLFMKNNVVLYENHTDKIFSGLRYNYSYPFEVGLFDAKYLCGVSVYIPRSEFPVTKAAWKATEWAQAIGASN